MVPSVQVLLVLVCSSAVALASYPYPYPKPVCPKVEDLVAKFKLQGETVPRGKDEPRPVCSSVEKILTELVVDIEVGTGYKETQKEICWVDKEENIRFVDQCIRKKCEGCRSYLPKRCVNVASKTTFYAICTPVSGSHSDLLTLGPRTTSKDLKIRQLTLDLPTCCQCQTFPYGC